MHASTAMYSFSSQGNFCFPFQSFLLYLNTLYNQNILGFLLLSWTTFFYRTLFHLK